MAIDLASALLETALAAIPGLGTIVALAWSFGRELQKREDENKTLRGDLEKEVKAREALEAEFKESEQSWQTLNRTLGQIEGALGIQQPMRGRAKSYPGGT